MPRPRLPITPERWLSQCTWEGDCLIWPGTVSAPPRSAEGYPAFYPAGRMVGGHRVIYELLVGPIPAGYEIDHTCCRTRCLNVEHLEAVTPTENKRRVFERGRGRNGQETKTACPQGHEYDRIGRRRDGRTFRVCSTCAAAAQRRFQERRRLIG